MRFLYDIVQTQSELAGCSGASWSSAWPARVLGWLDRHARLCGPVDAQDERLDAVRNRGTDAARRRDDPGYTGFLFGQAEGRDLWQIAGSSGTPSCRHSWSAVGADGCRRGRPRAEPGPHSPGSPAVAASAAAHLLSVLGEFLGRQPRTSHAAPPSTTWSSRAATPAFSGRGRGRVALAAPALVLAGARPGRAPLVLAVVRRPRPLAERLTYESRVRPRRPRCPPGRPVRPPSPTDAGRDRFSPAHAATSTWPHSRQVSTWDHHIEYDAKAHRRSVPALLHADPDHVLQL